MASAPCPTPSAAGPAGAAAAAPPANVAQIRQVLVASCGVACTVMSQELMRACRSFAVRMGDRQLYTNPAFADVLACDFGAQALASGPRAGATATRRSRRQTDYALFVRAVRALRQPGADQTAAGREAAAWLAANAPRVQPALVDMLADLVLTPLVPFSRLMADVVVALRPGVVEELSRASPGRLARELGVILDFEQTGMADFLESTLPAGAAAAALRLTAWANVASSRAGACKLLMSPSSARWVARRLPGVALPTAIRGVGFGLWRGHIAPAWGLMAVAEAAAGGSNPLSRLPQGGSGLCRFDLWRPPLLRASAPQGGGEGDNGDEGEDEEEMDGGEAGAGAQMSESARARRAAHITASAWGLLQGAACAGCPWALLGMLRRLQGWMRMPEGSVLAPEVAPPSEDEEDDADGGNGGGDAVWGEQQQGGPAAAAE